MKEQLIDFDLWSDYNSGSLKIEDVVRNLDELRAKAMRKEIQIVLTVNGQRSQYLYYNTRSGRFEVVQIL